MRCYLAFISLNIHLQYYCVWSNAGKDIRQGDWSDWRTSDLTGITCKGNSPGELVVLTITCKLDFSNSSLLTNFWEPGFSWTSVWSSYGTGYSVSCVLLNKTRNYSCFVCMMVLPDRIVYKDHLINMIPQLQAIPDVGKVVSHGIHSHHSPVHGGHHDGVHAKVAASICTQRINYLCFWEETNQQKQHLCKQGHLSSGFSHFRSPSPPF